MTNMDVHFSSEKQDWNTPRWLFDLLDAEFHFTCDVCATVENALVPNYYSPEDDGLAQFWTGTCFMNPPYKNTALWIRKAWESAALGLATVVCLIPARTDTKWWWDYVRHGEVRLLKGRLHFSGHDNGAPFPSAVVIFDVPFAAKTVYWEIP